MPWIRRLGLALTISALERELKRSAAGKRFMCSHREVRWFFKTVSRLNAIRAFNHAELVETRAKAADDVPRPQVRISRSPVTAGPIVVIYFCRRERKNVGISSLLVVDEAEVKLWWVFRFFQIFSKLFTVLGNFHFFFFKNVLNF